MEITLKSHRDYMSRMLCSMSVRDAEKHSGFITALYATEAFLEQLGIYARKVFQTKGKCFALKCDIRQFFPTIDHQVLLEIIGRKIKDRDALDLVGIIVESFTSDADQKTGIKGAPD